MSKYLLIKIAMSLPIEFLRGKNRSMKLIIGLIFCVLMLFPGFVFATNGDLDSRVTGTRRCFEPRCCSAGAVNWSY